MINKYLDIGLMTKWFSIFFVRYKETSVQADTEPVPQAFVDANTQARDSAQERYSEIRLAAKKGA